MGTGVYFTLEDLLGTFDGQIRHIVTQRIACALNLLCSILFRLCNNACAFALAFCTSLLDNLSSLFFRSVMRACRSAFADASIDPMRACACARSVLPFSAAAKPSAIFLASLVDCLCQRGPDELHRDHSQNKEHDHLEKDRRVQIHGRFPITS